jgi:protein N-terminal methyltransferase
MADTQSDTRNATCAQTRAATETTEPDASTPPDASIEQDNALQYWQSTNADTNSMLGGISSLPGFSHVSRVDLQGSRSFLAKLGIGTKNGRHPVVNILEGGAGCVFFQVLA